MVEHSSDRLDALFHALADPTRRAILWSLAGSEQSVSELAAPFDISLAGASKHIKVLERAGLVERTVRGRIHLCRLDARPMHAGMEWIRHCEQFWKTRLDILEDLLQAEDRAATPARASRKHTKPRTGRRKK